MTLSARQVRQRGLTVHEDIPPGLPMPYPGWEVNPGMVDDRVDPAPFGQAVRKAVRRVEVALAWTPATERRGVRAAVRLHGEVADKFLDTVPSALDALPEEAVMKLEGVTVHVGDTVEAVNPKLVHRCHDPGFVLWGRHIVLLARRVEGPFPEPMVVSRAEAIETLYHDTAHIVLRKARLPSEYTNKIGKLYD